jgi:hypothetical protein
MLGHGFNTTYVPTRSDVLNSQFLGFVVTPANGAWGWTPGGSPFVSGIVDGIAPHSGNFQAAFGSFDSLSQNIATIPGAFYTIDFLWRLAELRNIVPNGGAGTSCGRSTRTRARGDRNERRLNQCVLTAGLQKVMARVEIAKPAPRFAR